MTTTIRPLPVHSSQCVECSFPLPLRRARRDEIAATWECRICGARYRGVIDQQSPAEQRENVRRVCRR